MKTTHVVIESMQDCNISVLVLEHPDLDDEEVIKQAAQQVIDAYNKAELDFDGPLEIGPIHGACTPWTETHIQNQHGEIEKLRIAETWQLDEVKPLHTP